jgi:hypothetical protein
MSVQSKPLTFSDHFYFDEGLRDVAKDPEVVKSRIDFVLSEMMHDEETEDRVRHLGEIGSLYRILGRIGS